MAAKSRFPSTLRAVIFEPVASNAEAIRRIIEVNGFAGVETKDVALGAEEPLLGSVDKGDGMLRSASTGSEVVQFSTSSIDRHIAEEAITPTIIKLDVEGFENEVLRGGRDCLNRDKPRLWIELHPALLEEKGYNTADVISTLRSFGYEIYKFEDADGPMPPNQFHIWAEPI